MRQKLTNNLGLKILALLISTVLWIVSININDPVSQDSYNVNVQLKNVGSLTSAGKYLEITGDSDYIKVNVRGSRTVLSYLSAENIVAVADVNKMVGDNRIPIELSTTRLSDKIESIKSDAQYVTVNVENVEKLQLPITVSVQNSPAEGYILGQTSTNQNVVIISGPQSVVNQVESAAVEINVDKVTSDVNVTLPIHLYDSDGNILDTSKLNMSIDEVTTTATILQTKQISVSCVVKGEVLDGYVMVDEIECDPSVVTVSGKANAIKNINSIVVKDAIDVTGNDKGIKAVVDLKDYLPDGVNVVSENGSSLVNINVRIEKESELDIEIPADRIHIINLPEGYNAEVDDSEPFVVKILGQKDIVNAFSTDDFIAIVNVAHYLEEKGIVRIKEGIMNIPADITLGDNVHLEDDCVVPVIITKK